MEKQDARSLSEEAQEDLRRRVVEAVQKGLSQTEAAGVFAVARGTVSRWMGLVKRAGRRALKGRRRGRPPVSRLAPHQAATTVRMILSGCPDQLSLPFALWTREAVQQLLSRKFDVQVSVWTVGRYLRAWGLTPQKPVRRAYEQDPVAVRKWLEEEYPAIREQARQWKAQIHWLDEMGLRSDHQAGRSYGRRGQTPVVFGTGQRFRCNIDLFDHESGAIVLHDFPSAFHGAGVSEFSQPTAAPDAENQAENISDCGWPPGTQVSIGAPLAGRAR
jgi:transposase